MITAVSLLFVLTALAAVIRFAPVDFHPMGAALADRICDYLELPDDERRMACSEPGGLVAVIRGGIPIRALRRLSSELEVPVHQLRSALGIRHRNVPTDRGGSERFGLIDSDRVYRLARILARAVETLGSEERARDWLRAPNRGLGEIAPIDLVDTDAGTRDVEAALDRIDDGVFG